MKINKILGWPALLTVAAGLFGGCAVEPVGECLDRNAYLDNPAYTQTRVIRRVETVPARTIRYRSLPAVGERTIIRRDELAPVSERIIMRRNACGELAPVGELDTFGTRTRFDNRRYYRGGWRNEAYVPFGPRSPVSPSQWY